MRREFRRQQRHFVFFGEQRERTVLDGQQAIDLGARGIQEDRRDGDASGQRDQ
jgi:hypothetical protein